MNWHIISPPLIIVGVLLYHLSQKNVPNDANPLVVLAMAYAVATAICVAMMLATGDFRKGADLLRNQNWLIIVLIGVSAVLVEFGYLYAYRTGWKLSTTSITTGSFITTSLAVIGVLWFREQLTNLNVFGILLCIIGVICINMK